MSGKYIETRGARKRQDEKTKLIREVVTYGHNPDLYDLVAIYVDYVRSVNGVINLEEADELLIQISMIGGSEAIQQIQSLIATHSDKSSMDICRQSFNLIEAGVIPLFPLIFACIKFQHHRKNVKSKISPTGAP